MHALHVLVCWWRVRAFSMTKRHLPQWHQDRLSVTSVVRRHMWPTIIQFGIDNFVFHSFLSSPWFTRISLQIFKVILQFIIPSDLVIVFLSLFFLFGIIYKINLFSISFPLFFSSFKFGLYYFDCYLFVWDIFKNWLFYNSILHRPFPIKFDFYSFDFSFFHFSKFLKLIFFISSFNIKLVWNWIY